MYRKVTVRVPATSANLGPGFDTLGCALTLYNTLTFERSAKTEVFGCEPRFSGEDNLALVAFRRTCEAAGVTPPPVRLTLSADVPVSRGLGSSATLIVGGAVAADALMSLRLDREALLAVANAMEGHPDNVAPALYGGLVASLQEKGQPYAIPLSLADGLHFCAFVPDYEVRTHDARDVLPKTVPFFDATFNAAHVAVLVAALAEGRDDLIRLSLRDRLHQPYRRPLMAEYGEVEAAALSAGAVAFFLSGSGSTLMALYRDAAFVEKMKNSLAALSHGWRVLPLALDREGASLTELV